eukprot:scpid93023/ scgid8498/ SAM domain and HD domain-containing protein 1; Dendritic cell-derived IFNG-induced protein; Monocyte protein 5
MSGIMKRKRSTPPSSPSPAKKPCPSRSEQLSVLHKSWTPKDLKSYLRLCRIDDDVASRFEDNDVKGENLSEINDETLEKWNVFPDQRIEVMKIINNILDETVDEEAPPRLPKVFNDPVHGHIELDSLLMRIIDTPQFQRLRDIKQLGGAYFVFPGASHNRFEHSIGVSHLAGCLVGKLRQRQPSLKINDVDVLCVKLAGLCHDLGHGPFSHMFDAQFIPMVDSQSDWRHEDASVNMLRHMIEVNELQQAFFERGISEQDVIFIEEMIAGPQHGQDSDRDWKYEGRGKDKSFLYEIIANKRTGIDVDKWDYFARDCHHLGIANMFDYRRFMQFARVIEVEKTLRICTRDKEVGNLYDMFHTRDALHRRAYQHKTSNIIETMICEAFSKANDHFFLPGKDGKKVKMSEAIYDMAAYTHLSDRVFYTLLASTEPELKETRQILQAVQRRHLYRCVSQSNAPTEKTFSTFDAPRLARAIVKAVPESYLSERHLPVLTEGDVCVQIVNFSYGMRHEDPIDRMRFYQKDQPNKASKVRREQVSRMLPDNFLEQNIRLYIRDSQDRDKQRSASWCFQQWCVENDCTTPRDGGDPDISLTPLKMSQDPTEAMQSSQTPSYPDVPNAFGGRATPNAPSTVSQRLRFSG